MYKLVQNHYINPIKQETIERNISIIRDGLSLNNTYQIFDEVG